MLTVILLLQILTVGLCVYILRSIKKPASTSVPGQLGVYLMDRAHEARVADKIERDE